MMKIKNTLALALFATFNYNATINAQCVNPLGSSPNVFTAFNSNTNQMIVDNDLNTVIFIHRNDNSLFGGDNGEFRYDISTDNGVTWQVNQGNLNPGSTLGLNGGRYPQVGIYNPAGNTDPANATLVYHGSTNSGFDWNGYVTGSLLLDGAATSTEYYNQAGVSNTLMAGGFCQSTPGTFWAIDAISEDNFSGTGIRILKGTYEGGDVVWSVNEELTPDFNIDMFGYPFISDWNMAFDPTGMYGWIVLLTHLNGLSDYVYHPVFYSTTDGGDTWNGPVQLDLYSFSSITSVQSNPACGLDVDLTVDMYGYPHAMVGVFDAGNSLYWYNSYLAGHVFDFTYDGSSWNAVNLQKVGANSFANPKVSSSDDGSKIVFTWTESDLPSSSGYAPNLKAVAYDVPTGNKSCVINYALTCPSSVNGQMNFTAVSPNMIEEAGIYTVPVALTTNVSGNYNAPAQHYYLNGLSFTAADFSTPVTPTYPTITANGPLQFCAPGSVELTASASSSYLWSTGETTQTITAYGGYYWVVNPDEGYCIGESNSVVVESISPPDIYAWPTVLCPGGSVGLYAFYNSSGNSILWSNGATTDYITVTEPGSYSVTVDGCPSLYSIEVAAAETPSNDNICNAQTLTIGVVTPFDNTCATVEAGEPVPPVAPWEAGNQDGWFDESFSGFPVLDYTVWFSFIAPSTGAVNITTEGFDTQLALYSSSNYTCTGTLSLVAANDDAIDFYGSFINRAYCLKKGKRYFVQVDGLYGSFGAGTILVTAVPNTVTICHNGQTITVSGCALAAHLAHGDQIGPCDTKSSVAFIEEDETAASLSVYPNPSKDMMHLSFTSDEQESYTLQVFDVTGRLMLSEEKEAIIGENEHELNIGDYNPGMYFLVVKKGNNVMQTKLVKE